MAHRNHSCATGDPFGNGEKAENPKSGDHDRQERQIGKHHAGPFETRDISLKASGEHGVIDPFRAIHGPEKKNADQPREHLHPHTARPERPHVPGADDPHRLLHQDKEIAVQKKELRNKERRKTESAERMTDAGKRRGRDEKERRTDRQCILQENRTKGDPSRGDENAGDDGKGPGVQERIEDADKNREGRNEEDLPDNERTGISPTIMITTGTEKTGPAQRSHTWERK